MRLIDRIAGRWARDEVQRWLEDRRGASLVQFIAILPVFVIVIYGAWALFTVIGAHQRMCDAAHEAARYLQVEGPRFPEEWVYPDDWERVALEIAEEETAAMRVLRDAEWEPEDVIVWPPNKPRGPEGPDAVVPENINQHMFSVRVTQDITNPLGIFFPGAPRPGGEDGDPDDPDQPSEDARPTIKVTCQASGFYEKPPFRPTSAPSAGGTECRTCPDPQLPKCTLGPEPTDCVGPNCPTAEPCPICCD